MRYKQYLALFLLLMAAVVSCHKNKRVLKPTLVILENIDQIIPLEDSLVKPVSYQNIPRLDHLSLKETKMKFIAIVLPAVLIAKHNMTEQRSKVLELVEKKAWIAPDSVFYEQQVLRFKAKNIEDLLDRMITHPNSIVLAQAAVESGWGSSRFFRKGNNLFGIWSYRMDEPRMAANNEEVYLRRYQDISHSIEDYFVTLGRARPYQSFREIRSQSQEVVTLLPHLKYYSQLGKAYTDQLATIIRQNNLTQYDHYQIDPGYFFEE